MSDQPAMPERAYGCTFGCGNPYDVVIVQVVDSTTELLCYPCFVRMASEVAEAMTNPDSPAVRAAVAGAGPVETAPMRGAGPRKRGHNAPAGTDDADVLSAFDRVITADELPEEFR